MTRIPLTPTQRTSLSSTMLIEFFADDQPAQRRVRIQMGEDLFYDSADGTTFDAVILHDHATNTIYTAEISEKELADCASPSAATVILASVEEAKQALVDALAADDAADDALVAQVETNLRSQTWEALGETTPSVNPLWSRAGSTPLASAPHASYSDDLVVIPATPPVPLATLQELP